MTLKLLIIILAYNYSPFHPVQPFPLRSLPPPLLTENLIRLQRLRMPTHLRIINIRKIPLTIILLKHKTIPNNISPDLSLPRIYLAINLIRLYIPYPPADTKLRNISFIAFAF
ncbi:hypothetical protein BU16DRAFT_527466 [Lophium mytilinum]|uniref:Uncharacterized protein n=1 Tax=Lophium mytilinum TaxID=390894 RepID=A0A6A6QUA2_9PEZI|nr:hypothetical protein BU16DRAFT_527466 [Lophium mytilinum]